MKHAGIARLDIKKELDKRQKEGYDPKKEDELEFTFGSFLEEGGDDRCQEIEAYDGVHEPKDIVALG